MEYPCVVCEGDVGDKERALQCEICEDWEHVDCIRECERPDGALYDALVRCRTKCLSFICTRCRKKGSLIKQFMKHEYELAHVQDERLASARLLDQSEARALASQITITNLKEERDALKEQVKELTQKLLQLKKESPSGETKVQEVTKHESGQSDHESLESSSSQSSEDTISSASSAPVRSAPTRSPHPPGFKEISSRVEKFSGKRAEDGTFEVWLDDFEEATTDCGWSDKMRATWFSWFINGPAKATWQRTLTTDQKKDWKCIVKAFRGQYGVHVDPRTAYQRCNELRYEQFGSAQGLLNAMREYQRMAPEKLNDSILESILWNKVPVELQQEVKEITDGSVQELLMKLLRAESVVAERKRRSRETTEKTSGVRQYVPNRRSGDASNKSEESRGSNAKDPNQKKSTSGKSTQQGEASMQQIKCYRCKAKGHIAKNCPEAPQKPGANVIESEPTQEVSEEYSDPWLRTMSASGQVDEVPTRVPTYKAEIIVDSVRTRALLDHGAQVSIVRRELLPKVRETHGWTKEQYQARNLKLDRQPIGANGAELGAVALVRLEVSVEGTDKTLPVPCYVLNSDKPLWKGELWNCGLVLGTNCLEKLGFSITHPNGQMVIPAGKEGTASQDTNTTGTAPSTAVCTPVPSSTEAHVSPQTSVEVCTAVDSSKGMDVHASSTDKDRTVLLDKHLHIGPFQTKMTPVNVMGVPEGDPQTIGMITPSEVLANLQCDFTDEIWSSGTSGMLAITNWSGEPLAIEQGSTMGIVEEVDPVGLEDPVWSDTDPAIVDIARLDELTDSEVSQRKAELERQLVIGGTCSKEECGKFKQLLLHKHESLH